MDSVYLKKAREASCKVIDLYITSITFLFCDMLQANEALPPLNKERFDPLKADALDKLKEAINHEADLYDSIPEDEIMDYKEIDEGNYGQVRFIYENRISRHIDLKRDAIEHPELIINGYSLLDFFNALTIINKIKDSFNCFQLSKSKGDISKNEYELLELSRMLVLLISLSSSPIAEQAVLDAKFDITKLKRITVEDIDMQFDTNFSSLFGLDEFSHMVLKYLFIFINKYLSITPGTDNKYIEAQLLTSIISDCNFAINALNKEDLIKFEAFLNEFESRTHNPACARIRELSIDRRRKLL